jgi:hypothetical protein
MFQEKKEKMRQDATSFRERASHAFSMQNALLQTHELTPLPATGWQATNKKDSQYY